MSYYNSDKLLRDWATENLRRFLDPRRYTKIFDALHSPKRSQGLTRLDLGILKLMLGEYRPERGQREQKAYAESNAVSVVEISDTLGCNVSSVRRSKSKLNRLAMESSPQGKRAALILFHDMGVCIRATFWDAIRARSYSENMGEAQSGVHANNVVLADEKRHDVKIAAELLARFKTLSPVEQQRLLETTVPQ